MATWAASLQKGKREEGVGEGRSPGSGPGLSQEHRRGVREGTRSLAREGRWVKVEEHEVGFRNGLE